MRMKVRHIAPILCFQIANIARNTLFALTSLTSSDMPTTLLSLFISEIFISTFFAVCIILAFFNRSMKNQIIHLFKGFHIFLVSFSIAFFFMDKLSSSFRSADALRQLVAFSCISRILQKCSSRNVMLIHQILHDVLLFIQLATFWSFYSTTYENSSVLPLDGNISIDSYLGITSSLFAIVYIVSQLMNRQLKVKKVPHQNTHAEDSIKQQTEPKKRDTKSISKDNFDILSVNQFLPMTYNNSPSLVECPPLQLNSSATKQNTISKAHNKSPKILLFKSSSQKKIQKCSNSVMLSSEVPQSSQDQSALIKTNTIGDNIHQTLSKSTQRITDRRLKENLTSENNNNNPALNSINLQIFNNSNQIIPEDKKHNHLLVLEPENTEARNGFKKILSSSNSSAICSGSSARPDSPNSFYTHKEQKLKVHNNRHQSDSDESSLTEEEIDSLISQIISKLTLNKRRKRFLRSSTIFRKKVASIIANQKAENEENHTQNSNPLSLKSIEDSPVDQILENISLGLLCYEVDSREIVFVNHHIKEMFSEQEERDVFASMMQLKNYMQQDPSSGMNNSSQIHQQQQQQQQMMQSQQLAVPQASRNLDMIPADLFTQDFRQVSALQIIQNPRSQTEITRPPQLPLTYSSLLVTNLQSPRDGIIMDSSGKQIISFSQQNTLKQQLNELVALIQNEGFSGSTLTDVKIRFMASFKPIPGNNVKKLGLLKTSPLLYGSNNINGNSTNATAASATKERILQITLTPLKQGMRQLVLFIVEDVTHFNQIKVLESLNKNKSFMLSQVSHEIRNPISCIIAMLEEIQTKSHDEQQELMSCVQAALQSSKMLLNLLNDLLDMSQIKAGKFKLVLEQFDFLDLLNEVKDMMQPLARNKNNTIVLSVKEERNWVLVSDRYRIRQILINLISNSIKYTSKGQIFLGISVEPTDERLLRVSVRDEGVGIKKEFRQTLFQAFSMGDDMESKKKHNPHGVGLGLMISNTIAKNLKPLNLQSNNSSIINNSNQNNNINVSSALKQILNPPPSLLKAVKSNSSNIYNPDEGLILNEELEKGSEFYFRVFNHAPVNTLDQQLQQQHLGQLKNRHSSLNVHRIRGDSIMANQQKDLLFLPVSFIPRHRSAADPLHLDTKERSSILDTHLPLQQDLFSKIRDIHNNNNNNNNTNNNQKILSSDQINSENESDSESNSNSNSNSSESNYNPSDFNATTATPAPPMKSKSNYKNLESNALNDIIRQHVVRRNLDTQFLDTEVRIMVVDDDQFSALALRSRITAAFRVYNRNLPVSFATFFSGSECITELKKRACSYSFLFIDSQMPELDGYETIQLIDEAKLRQNPTPQTGFKEIIITLCSGMPKEDTKLFVHHIPHFLQKPIEQEGLMQIIQQSFQEYTVETS